MKLKEILKNNVYSHFDGTNPTLSGSGLKALTPFFNDIEEFNGKNIQVIDTLDGLVTVKGVENLRENVKIQTLFLIDDDVFIRCTADSLKIESLYKHEETYTDGLEMGQIPNYVDDNFNLQGEVLQLAKPEYLEPDVVFFNKVDEIPTLKLCPNGDIFVKGRLADNDKEVVDAMREFLRTQFHLG